MPLKLETLTLKAGSTTKAEAEAENSMCVMEAVAYVAGEPWSDHPKCASKVIAAFCRSWNDTLDDETRQRLKPYIPKLIGTNHGPATEARLAWVVTDWQMRVQAPAWMKLTETLKAHGAKLAALPELTQETWPAAKPTLHAAGAAAWAAARDAAWAAAGDAAWAAARDAARAAARDAARDAAGDAAWAAARDAARAAAWAAARDALQPTVKTLLEEAFQLLDRLILVAKDAKK